LADNISSAPATTPATSTAAGSHPAAAGFQWLMGRRRARCRARLIRRADDGKTLATARWSKRARYRARRRPRATRRDVARLCRDQIFIC